MLSRRWFRWRQQNRAAAAMADLLDPTSPRLNRAWYRTAIALRQTADYLDEQGVAYVAFEIPLDVQMSEGERPDWFRREIAGRPVDRTMVGGRFGAILSGTTGGWQPTLRAWQRAWNPSLYFPTDPHWTPAGHAFAAELLLPEVVAGLRRIRP